MIKRPFTRAGMLALIAMLVVGTSLVSSMPLAGAPVDVLRNGDFEAGFALQPGCGMVGAYWSCFQNGGAAEYGFYDDQWPAVVADGKHSQLIEINTKQVGGDPDRYAGIYQTVEVVPGAAYQLSLRGMIRADDQEGDPWRYRVQVGFDLGGGRDWTRVSHWIELPWDTYYPRSAPGAFSSYTTAVTASSSRLTLFIRVWKKWGDWYRELDVNIDRVSLVGPAAAPAVMPRVGDVPPPPEPTVAPPPSLVLPPPPTAPAAALPAIAACTGPNLIANGDFEQGFYPWGVGYYWGWFQNGGQAEYGFYDDQWSKTVYSGRHSQLIEINTLKLTAADADRYAGIYQVVSGLTPGVQYELALAGLLREEASHADEDPYRYRVQWGYLSGGWADWTRVTNWQELPWDAISLRTDPGPFQTYRATFIAPASQVTIFLRAWKKWPTTGRELDVNIDAVSLRACGTAVIAPPPADGPYVHKVRAGETLSQIAARYGVSVKAIAKANRLRNINYIYVGQKLIIPGLAQAVAPPPATTAVLPPPPATNAAVPPPPSVAAVPLPPDAAAAVPPPPDATVVPPPPTAAPAAPASSGAAPAQVYVVRRGDTLSAIAARYGTTAYAIGRANGLYNLNWIRVGQRLVIP